MAKEHQEGWVIVDLDGKTPISFTFARTRTDAIKTWTDVWSKPGTWQAHYKKGYRCVRAVQVIETD